MLSKLILKYKLLELALDTFLDNILINFRKASVITTEYISPGDRFSYIKTLNDTIVYTDCRIVDVIDEHSFMGVSYRIILINAKLHGKLGHYTIMEEIDREHYVFYYV